MAITKQIFESGVWFSPENNMDVAFRLIRDRIGNPRIQSSLQRPDLTPCIAVDEIKEHGLWCTEYGDPILKWLDFRRMVARAADYCPERYQSIQKT